MKYTALVMVVASWAGIWAAEKVTDHADRPTPQVIVAPDSQPGAMVKREAVARQYLEDNWRRFGLEPGAVNVESYRVQQSLLGTHYHFRQTIGGIPLAFAEIIVSVSADSNRIFKVFNSTWPDALRNTEKKLPVLLEAADALDISWNHMRVSGPMTTLPSMDLMYYRIDSRFVLVYQVNLNLEDPAGSWSILVDAGTGKVHSVEQIDLHRHRANVDFSERRAPVADLERELAAMRQRQQVLEESKNAAGKRASGSTRTFDPDPATTLNDQDLDDFSPLSAFEPAYFIRDLQGITQDPDDTYRLVGPWCQIINFEPPSTPPATVNGNDGFFDFERGDNGFYDAMTYFHLDQNQRYIQSLGFTGDMGIQTTSIETDANGLNGQDNSHYLSNVTSIGVNRLAFGHGGVPDNEDADVILHEYGHAIHKWINNMWGFNADEGAMGEGFGDYWGAIYSLGTPNGPLFHPEWIYSWDGHNGYWFGRYMDRLDFPYNPNSSYGPHQAIEMYYESDELWGTPLFQAALELYSMGIPLEESNRIILQGHFGLGSGLKMPVLAQATVDAAAMLYPDGPHAQVFRNAFGRHGILELQDNYTYLSAHIPPGTADWINEIVIVNPNDQEVTITSTVFESDTSSIGLSDYSAHDPVVQNLAAGASFTLIPEGDKQRWVRIESNLPLAGTSFLHRDREVEGEERAGIPLFADPEINSTIILPHIPADRAQFFSSAVILNPGETAVDLTIELFGAQGTDLSNLLSPSAPNRLEAHQKWVGFLAPFAGQGLFDDSGSNELVSYVKITGNGGDLAAFQLYGYVDSGNNLASSGIKALSNTSASPMPIAVDHTWAIRVSRTHSDFTSFSILNPSDSMAQARVRLVYTDGTISPEQTVSIGVKLKKLGLNNIGGFSFPYQDNPVFSEAGDDLQAMLITSNQDLRIFELVGHNDKSTLDGAAVNLLTSHTVFADAKGTLEILRVGYPDETTEEVTQPDGQPFNARELTVTFVEPGQQPSTTTYTMRPGERKSIAIPGNGGTSITVEGTRFTAAVIDYNQTDRSLTVINGQQVEFYPDEQN